MSSGPPSDSPPKPPTISSLDSPSSYLNASKQDKKAIKAAYSEIFKIPKKKRKSDDKTDGGVKGGTSTTTTTSSTPNKKRGANSTSSRKTPSPKRASSRGSEKKEAVNEATEAKSSPTKTNEDDPMSVLGKGDLVRLDSEQTKSGRIQGGLARVTKVYPPNDPDENSEYTYDIEYVLGGKVFKVTREELLYTTAEAEGLVSTNLRERRSSNKGNASGAGTTEDEDKKAPAKRKRDYANRRPPSRDGSVNSRGSSRKAPAKKLKEAVIKTAPKRNSRRTSTDDDSSDANTSSANNDSRAMDMYTRHKRELERSLARLEKVDRFGFFFDKCPPEFDEDYEDADETDISFPEGPPFNFAMLRKRFAAGRYDLNFVKAEVERRKAIQATMNNDETAPLQTAKESDVMDVDKANCDETLEETDFDALLYDEVAKSMCHPLGVDWDTFNKDVIGMCDAAIQRNPEDGENLTSGHLGNSANKIKKLIDEMYTNYGCKRRAEMEASEARLKYENILNNCGNREAAMQGKWRKQPFPERKYERLESSSVICDGLSEMDKSYAMYELGTSIPDSFVGLAYTYDDSGQHSEMWMKTVVDETTSKPKSRRKKKSPDDSAHAVKDENKEQSAAAALAKDDGVTKAQVQNTMQALLIQVQDKVMTDLGVMNQPEARSANWDDGDDRRNYRGGAAEVEQGSNFSTLPEVAEQEVWGIDCYTRKNVMALVESEFNAEIAVEFMEKWLLPAINACPVDLAHNISTAARILEGLPISHTNGSVKETALNDGESQSESLIKADDIHTDDTTNLDESQPNSPRKKAPESSVFLRNALESKMKNSGPPWLKAAARLIRLAADSLDEGDGFFRIHPKGHGSVVIGEHGLKANSLVTYYRGEVYPAWRWCEKMDAIEKTQKDLNLRPNLPDFYNMAMERPMKDPRGYAMLFVDASRKSGLGSSFSHSCNPSCEVRVVALKGKLSLAMNTIRDLEQGEELTFDYNAVTESVNEYRFAICLCGHTKCRGSFLHLTSAPCYQQVLSRNCPMAARFANLVRGCMKQVMSREDSDLLQKHGFSTAAFGAVSFNHHSKTNAIPHSNNNEKVDKDERTQLGELLLQLSSTPARTSSTVSSASMNSNNVVMSSSNNVIPDSSEDSIENVPIWLRTYAADTLRYIEYERRALPVALLCNQMERVDKQKAKLKREKRAKDKNSDKEITAAPESKEKPKPVSGSKPKSSYFFFLDSKRDDFLKVVEQEQGGKLKGLVLSQAVNKYGAQVWGNLSEEEKQSWKEKSIAEWKKNGGQEKAKLEGERQRDNGLENRDVNEASSGTDGIIEQKEITFADAEAEGLSAMEQRIQQLAQSLSRVGRVLDRHRESEYRKLTASRLASPRLLRDLVPSPLKIMSDEEVVNWMWNDKKGVIHNFISMIDQHFPKPLLLQKILTSTRASYPLLDNFTAFSDEIMHPSVDAKKGRNAPSSADARALVREALLDIRSDINNFLAFAEKSHFDAIKEKKNEAARRRDAEKKSKKNSKTKVVKKITEDGEDNTVSSNVALSHDSAGDEDAPIPSLQYNAKSQQDFERKEEISVCVTELSNKAMRIRGGGEHILCSESNPPANAITLDHQNGLSALREGVVPSNEVVSTDAITTDDQNRPVMLPDKVLHNGAVSTNTPAQVMGASHDVPAQMPSSENVDMGDGLTKLDTAPGITSEDKKSVITPSSPTQTTQAGANSKEKATAIPTPKDTDHSSEAKDNLTKECGIAETDAQSSAITTLALMANLAAAAPPAIEQQHTEMNPLSASTNSEMNCLSVAANLILSPKAGTESQKLSVPIALPEQEPKKRKTTAPMTPEQVTYLKNWLLDPNHILNPYPTDAEKKKITSDIGVELSHLDRWLSRHRKPIISSRAKEPVNMKWTEADSAHWTNFRRQRYMLEASADLLLMYASTNTFFLLEPFNRFDSTPIEVYARELGNQVPSHLAASNKAVPCNQDTQDHNTLSNPKAAPTELRLKSKDSDKYCSPEDVITEVTVSYSEEYVISQLLQWFNGGIGQLQGLPDIYGCVMLPPVSGCWDEIKNSGESKVSTYRRATDYSTKCRLRLAAWIDDRTKRGSPWTEDIARYFCKMGTSPDPTLPLGSPVIDYLVTGIEENIQFVSSTLRDKDGKGVNSPTRSHSRSSASDRLQSTVDAGMPAQAVANWVQCENPNCLKWRKLPWHVDVDLLPEKFFCKDNIWTTGKKSCDVPEDKWDMSDAPVKFDTVDEDFAIGVWFDVQRDGKVGYHEAQVTEIDFNSAVKRVKFHFWRLSNVSDEWVEVGSPRIAPHHSYTPRPMEGYGESKKNKKKGSRKRKSADAVPKSNVESSENTVVPKENTLNNPVLLPPALMRTTETATSVAVKKCSTFPKSTVDYLNKWLDDHKSFPFPSNEEKLIIMASTGLNKRQLSDWLAKARKKHKHQTDTTSKNSDHGNTAIQPHVNNSPALVKDPVLELKDAMPLVAQSSIVSKSNIVSADQKVTTQVIIPGIPKSSALPKASTASSQSKSSVGLSEEAKVYLSRWINLHRSHPFPDKREKDKMLKDLGLVPSDLRKLDGWFSRARKKLKDCTVAPQVVQAPVQAATSDSQISPLDVEVYLKAWMSRPENMIDGKPNLNPNIETRDKMSAESGIESRRIESWFYRLRKKVKKQDTTISEISQHLNQKVAAPMPASTATGPSNATSMPATGQSNVTSIQTALGPNSIILKPALAATGPNNITSKPASAATGPNNVTSKPAAQEHRRHSTQLNQMNQSTAAATAAAPASCSSSNLDLLFEAASIRSAASEVITTQSKSNSHSFKPEHNQSRQNLNMSNPKSLPPESIARAEQRNQMMRFSPIFCQQIQNHSMPSRGPTPPNNQNSLQGLPARNFAPIRSDGSFGQHHNSRGPTPNFIHHQNTHPAYLTSDPVRRNEQYQRFSPTYLAQHAPHQYSRPPHVQPPSNNHNVQYQQSHQADYNMHNRQQNNGQQHQPR